MTIKEPITPLDIQYLLKKKGITEKAGGKVRQVADGHIGRDQLPPGVKAADEIDLQGDRHAAGKGLRLVFQW